MIKICFVCTGNTCRSIMAERLLKKAIKDEKIDNIKVSSRGLFATGEQITECARNALKKMKASSASRKSVKLGKIDKDTLYITMTEAQRKEIKSKNVISFASLTGEEVLDPYGQNDEIYFQTAKQIDNGIKILLEKLKKWREL